MGVPEPILKVMAEKGFREPTEIQRLTMPAAILGRRDILGAAETGSGKTLAFGIPIIHGIMQMKQAPKNQPFRKLSKKQTKGNADDGTNGETRERNKNKKGRSNREERDNWTPPPDEVNNFPDFGRDIVEDESDVDDDDEDAKPLYALVLTPTRELAVQVKDHLVAAAKYTGIRVAAIFGGLAQVKQERVLSKCPEIVVATPGRLWELITEGNKHLNKLNNINFLVVDETDRMIEKGHFEELKQILERLNADEARKEQRQNFVFSATLTLIHELPQYLRLQNMNRKRKLQSQTAEQKLQTVIEYFGISQPKIIDITPSQTTGGTAQKLTECRITCSRELKDLYLYYFLQKHRGRTIVFCNSIDCVRRLAKLFAILDCTPWPLHAKMAQRQRLKNLERFTQSSTGLLIATDVAARGLDIPNVEHVIHYQVPRTSENYIHRSGRTARGNKEGIAVLLMEPGEIKDYVKLCRSLKRSKLRKPSNAPPTPLTNRFIRLDFSFFCAGEDLPLFPVADKYLSAVKDRVNLAREIDVQELKLRRKNTDIGWLKKQAKEMDIMVDDMSDFSEADLYDSDDGGGVIERSLERRELKQKQDALKRLLAKPIFPKGISYKYPSTISASGTTGASTDGTTTAISIVDSMLRNGAGGDATKDKAVTVMKNAIEEYKIAKKNRNKRIRPL